MRKFNITGTCVPEENYMVDITDKLEQIKKMVDDKAYFAINRGRQYGKTTTLACLEKFLSDEYTVISIRFEALDAEEFANTTIFSQVFLKQIYKALRFSSVDESYRESWKKPNIKNFNDLSDHITDMCEGKKIVLFIDEVDKASNHRVFLGFLSKLRDKFLARRLGKDFTFHSVILAGVYDIRNIKLKMVQEGLHTPAVGETTMYNSPWNIATQFEVSMSFSIPEITTMLNEYEHDHQTKMNISEIATEIYNYTNGYPVLVSHICKYVHERLEKNWIPAGIRQAVKLILKENTPLFESLVKNLTGNKELSQLTYNILMIGTKWPFNIHDPFVNLGVRYGYFKEKESKVVVSNKIFEICLTNFFINEAIRTKIQKDPFSLGDETGIVENNKFNMQTCLEKFVQYYHKYYSDKDEAFLEREARILFLMFLSPIINGNGFAHIESQSADGKQTDVLITYLNQQFIIELKIWRGLKKHERAYDQLLGYMEKFGFNEGYLLTFDFRQEKKLRQKWVDIVDGKKVFDVLV